MKRKIEIILLCLFILTIGCQKEELYSDSQENTSELTNLQLLKSNDLIVNDIMGSRTKSAALNNKVDYEYPWLLDLGDNKDRVLYCMDSEDNFTDRKIIYVKNGDKRFSYIVERAYVFSSENERENMKGESIAVFSGIVTIYTADEVPVYSYFYSNNELVGETNLYEELKSNSSGSRVKKQAASDEAILNGGFLLEVDVFGNRHSGGGGSSTSGIWFLQNSGRYTNWSGGWSSPNINGNYNYGGNNGGTNGSKPNKPINYEIYKYERVDIELAYLKQRGAKELAEIFEKLAFDPDLTVKDRIKLYDAIHEAYLQLQGEYMMAIFTPDNLATIFFLSLPVNLQTKIAKFSPNFVNSSAKIWSELSATGPIITGTQISKYFTLSEKFFVNPNATKHMAEYIIRLGPSYSIPLRSQLILSSFKASVDQISKSNNLIMGKMYKAGNWEFIFSAPRVGERLIVIKHARMIK